MSIASEIQALNTNLTSAKNAVTAKGGTVGDTGLAGLADEIATIPSGGGLDNYGSITYLDSNNVEQTLTLTTEEDYLELGTHTGAGSDIIVNDVVINNSNIKSVAIADGVQYIPDYFCYAFNNLTHITIPSSVHYIGGNVLSYCNITTANMSLDNVINVGNNFMANNINFNLSISLPKIRNIDSSFLQGCSGFNSSIILNDNMETIGTSFLSGCTSYAQSFTIPSGLIINDAVRVPIGGQFMYNCKSFTGNLVCTIPPDRVGTSKTLCTNDASAIMYTTGITLTGTYASEWKTAFPDYTSSPYRKLILG